jgi:type IV secretory pathway VirJ component
VILEQFRISILMTVALLASAWGAQAGPCTSQIAATEQQINQSAAVSPPGGAGTPSADQAIGAQLHHQPTPSAVENAEHQANAQGEAALEQARKADASGNADACTEALREARHLYGLD